MSRAVANKALGLVGSSSKFLPTGCAALLGELSQSGNMYSDFNQNRYVLNIGVKTISTKTLSMLPNDSVMILD